MNFLQVLLIVGVLWSQDWVHGLDCTNPTYEQKKCLNQSGLSSPEDVTSDVTIICSSEKKDAVKNGLRCMATFTRECARVAGISLGYTITPDTAATGIDYLCNRLNDLDAACMKLYDPAIKRCKIEAITSVSGGSAESKICTLTSMLHGCHEQKYGKCSGKTLQIYTNYSLTYDTPPACGTNALSPPLVLLAATLMATIACWIRFDLLSV